MYCTVYCTVVPCTTVFSSIVFSAVYSVRHSRSSWTRVVKVFISNISIYCSMLLDVCYTVWSVQPRTQSSQSVQYPDLLEIQTGLFQCQARTVSVIFSSASAWTLLVLSYREERESIIFSYHSNPNYRLYCYQKAHVVDDVIHDRGWCQLIFLMKIKIL